MLCIKINVVFSAASNWLRGGYISIRLQIYTLFYKYVQSKRNSFAFVAKMMKKCRFVSPESGIGSKSGQNFHLPAAVRTGTPFALSKGELRKLPSGARG
jgi:hypothetical protein